jgi:hypothetical protein
MTLYHKLSFCLCRSASVKREIDTKRYLYSILVIANDFAKVIAGSDSLIKSQVLYFFVQRQLFAEQDFIQVQGALPNTLKNMRNN